VTRNGPIEALQSHLSSPFENNINGSILNLPNVIGQ
jgi:light-harvesting complex I chlorophyll a/b binding protein 5